MITGYLTEYQTLHGMVMVKILVNQDVVVVVVMVVVGDEVVVVVMVVAGV